MRYFKVPKWYDWVSYSVMSNVLIKAIKGANIGNVNVELQCLWFINLKVSGGILT